MRLLTTRMIALNVRRTVLSSSVVARYFRRIVNIGLLGSACTNPVVCIWRNVFIGSLLSSNAALSHDIG